MLRTIPLIATILVLPSLAAAQPCDGWEPPTLVAELGDTDLDESSGLVLSEQNPGVLWTHNDSGDGPVLYAAALDGTALGQWRLDGVSAVDWEDLALGPCELGGALACLYVGDTGNNEQNRSNLAVLRVREPLLDVASLREQPARATIEAVERFSYRFPDGNWDCESLLVDPLTSTVYLVSKVTAGASTLYRFPTLTTNEETQLERVAEATFGGIPLFEQATTGADFAHDGSRFVVRGYGGLYVFELGPERDLAARFAGDYQSVRVDHEQQGEAVCFGPDGRSLWTSTEGAPTRIQEYRCREASEEVDPEDVPDGAVEGSELTEPEPELEPTPDGDDEVAAESEAGELEVDGTEPLPDAPPATQSSGCGCRSCGSKVRGAGASVLSLSLGLCLLTLVRLGTHKPG